VKVLKYANVEDVKQFSHEKFVKKTLFDSERLVVDIYCFEPGQVLDLHKHPHSDQVFYFVEGSGVFTVGGEEKHVRPGDAALAPANVDHGIKNNGAIRMIAFQVTAPKP